MTGLLIVSHILSAIVKKRPRYDLSDFTLRKEKLEKNVNLFLDQFKKNSVVIWGAGHQSLAIITLLNIGKRIKFVIDSATFKQGKFTPATHIPIVHPDELRNESIEAVIIMAASYSDEVANIIRNEFKLNIKVTILRDYGLEHIK